MPIYYKEVANCISSVIFVHGLGSNPDTTWNAGNSCWITDFLPSDLTREGLKSSVRLFKFNYDSFWMREANPTGLVEIGGKLLRELLSEEV